DSGAPAVRRTAAHPDASAPGAMPAAYSTAPYSRIDNLAEMTGDSAIGAKLRAAVLDELDLIRQEAGRKAMPRRHERFERVAQRYCDTLCTMPFNQIDSLGHDCAGGRKESFGDLTQFSVELFDVSHLVVDPRDAADLIQKARKAVRRLATSDDHYRWMAEDVKGTSRFFAGAGIDFSILRGYEGTLGTEPAGRKWLLRVTLVLEMGDGNPVPAFSPGPKAHGHGKPAARTHAAPLD
ncbi:MAG: hypothetical protein KGH63_01600, partial [Candidatus Micrarchaeota archaeon]|nr:hypothetical protein [Candidatus Micrarchaeota archaeon]